MQTAVQAANGKVTKADRTKARLIEVAKRLYQEHGSDHVTVRRIAAAAKIEAGSIYYHFSSRDEIMRAVLESGVGGAQHEVLQAIAEAGADSSPLERLRAALGAHLKYTLREHFSSRLKSIRRLPKRLRDHHMKQEREYAAIFAGPACRRPSARACCGRASISRWCACSPWARSPGSPNGTTPRAR